MDGWGSGANYLSGCGTCKCLVLAFDMLMYFFDPHILVDCGFGPVDFKT